MSFLPSNIENFLKEGIISYDYILFSLSVLLTIHGYVGVPMGAVVTLET